MWIWLLFIRRGKLAQGTRNRFQLRRKDIFEKLRIFWNFKNILYEWASELEVKIKANQKLVPKLPIPNHFPPNEYYILFHFHYLLYFCIVFQWYWQISEVGGLDWIPGSQVTNQNIHCYDYHHEHDHHHHQVTNDHQNIHHHDYQLSQNQFKHIIKTSSVKICLSYHLVLVKFHFNLLAAQKKTLQASQRPLSWPPWEHSMATSRKVNLLSR